MLHAGCGILGQLLAADPGYRGARLPCGNGHDAEFIAYRDKTIDTVPGPVTLRRAWYHCEACKHGFAPRDAELGVAGASLSPGLTAMNDKAAAAGPFAKAAGLLEDLAGVRLTAKRVERAAEASGTAAAEAVRERSALIAGRKIVPLPPCPLPDMLYGVIDGTGVPMTAAETAGRAGKGEDGRARTREAKLAVFFTQDELDDGGYPVRNRDSSSYIATFEPAAVFGDLVKAEGIRRGAGHVRQLVVLGDGAPWIWNLADRHFPKPPRSWTCATPASTCTSWPGCWSSCSATTAPNGSPPGSANWTPATPAPSPRPPPSSRSPGRKPTRWTRPWATSGTTPAACGMPTSALSACSSAPGPWKPGARRSSGSASNCPA
jgi:hypothetical protein